MPYRLGALLKNFLDALSITGAENNLKRVLLVTGGKYYGTHFGIIKQPCEESDPRIEGPEYPPNFYYVQQDILMEAAKGKNWDWVRSESLPSAVVLLTMGQVITQPGAVIGLAKSKILIAHWAGYSRPRIYRQFHERQYSYRSVCQHLQRVGRRSHISGKRGLLYDVGHLH
jgi:hypothetical protein